MKPTVFLFTFFICLFSSKAQTNTDSLVNILNTNTLSSEEQLLIYTKLCAYYEINDIEKFFFYAQKGLELTKKEKNKLRIVVFNNFYGRYYIYKSDYGSALKYLELALDYAIGIKDKEWEGHIYGNIAMLYSNKGDFKTGIEYYQKSISCFEIIGKDDSCVMAYANIGGR